MPGARAFGVAPLDSALLADPIAFLAAEHRRQRAVLGHLDRLAPAPATRSARLLASSLLCWLTRELPLHRADAADLLGTPDPEPGPAELVAAGLRALAGRRVPGPGFAAAVTAFIRSQHRRIAAEEEAIRPLAAGMLDAEALLALGRRMAARHGFGEAMPPPPPGCSEPE